MANVNHADLTGSALHEPKGADTAAANTVYVFDGAGSGSAQDINTLVTVTNFTTGDCKLTWKATADSGWVMMNDGSIGDALSSATTRANADCEDLFTLLWNNISDTYAAVSSGRGANAAADWAAHKTIALPKVLGRSFLLAGNPAGLTTHSLGQIGGAETHQQTLAELASHTHVGSTATAGSHTHAAIVTDPGHIHSTSGQFAGVTAGGDTGLRAGGTVNTNSATTGISVSLSTDGDHTHSVTISTDGGSTPFSIVNPYSAINVMIKL